MLSAMVGSHVLQPLQRQVGSQKLDVKLHLHDYVWVVSCRRPGIHQVDGWD